MANKLEIGPADAGAQLARFLERRLSLPRGLVRKWLRTGQVRVNGKRSQPERPLLAGDVVRLPPWAEGGGEALCPCTVEPDALGPDVGLVYQDEGLLVLNKPYGLPVHGGTRHRDSLSARLKAACGAGFYPPAPAHRLDLHASGLILAGKTHAAQTALHALFREAKDELGREYLCWTRGDAAEIFPVPSLCVDWLTEELDAEGRERMSVVAAGPDLAAGSYGLRPESADWPDDAEKAPPKTVWEARAFYHCLDVRAHPKFGPASLIRARLLTGRKHQIRVQLAARGLPLLGDRRYGGPGRVSMMLHASRVSLPGALFPGGLNVDEPRRFVSNPDWPEFFAPGDVYD